MDLLSVLRTRLDSLAPGDYSPGLRAVVLHIEVALAHLRRGEEQVDDSAFTDAIYRTNQAFEGSLKEAFRVLTGLDPLKKTPFEIETYLQEHAILRPRVISQLSAYRKDWRNPSTHDYRLDFDEDEALLAIVSVFAFAAVLIDQMAEKISFDTARAQAPSSTAGPPDLSLKEQVVAAVRAFDTSTTEQRPNDKFREVEIVGALAGYLTSTLSKARVEIEPSVGDSITARPDLIISSSDEKVLLEIKRSRHGTIKHQKQFLSQMVHMIAVSGIKEGILYVHSEGVEGMLAASEHKFSGVDARVVVLARQTPTG